MADIPSWPRMPWNTTPKAKVPGPGDVPRVSSVIIDPLARKNPAEEHSLAILEELRHSRQLMERSFQEMIAIARSRVAVANVVKEIPVNNANALTVVDCVKELGGVPALAVACLAVGTGTVQVETADMAGPLTITAGSSQPIFQNEEITRFKVLVSGGSGTSRWRINGWQPPQTVAVPHKGEDVPRLE